NHWLAVRCIGRCSSGKGCHCASFRNTFVHDLTISCLTVAEHQVMVDRNIVLTTWVANLQRWEPLVHTEGTCLIRDDRNYALAQFLFAHDFLEGTYQCHGASNILLTRALGHALELIEARCLQRRVVHPTLRQEAMKYFTAFEHVLNLRSGVTWVVVRR